MDIEDDTVLWGSFVVLFAVIVGAAFLPVRPLVWVFPLWGIVVLAAMLGAVAAAVLAARSGWPAETKTDASTETDAKAGTTPTSASVETRDSRAETGR